jgi:hypothetical protein
MMWLGWIGMKMVISNYKLVAGLIDSSYRSRINKEIKEKGSAKILIDYWMDGQSAGGQVTPYLSLVIFECSLLYIYIINLYHGLYYNTASRFDLFPIYHSKLTRTYL